MDNPRVDKTKRSFSNALMFLLRSSELNDITVSSLCRKAHLNRSTFYAHYRNIQDVLDQLKDDILEKLFLDEPPYIDKKSLILFIRYNRELFDILARNSSLMEDMVSRLREKRNLKTTKASIMTTFAVFGFVGLVAHEQQQGKISDEELFNFLNEITEELTVSVMTSKALDAKATLFV